jgi:TPR repeat protein
MTTLADAYDKGQFGLGMNPDQARYWRLRAAQASPPITHQPIVEK